MMYCVHPFEEISTERRVIFIVKTN